MSWRWNGGRSASRDPRDCKIIDMRLVLHFQPRTLNPSLDAAPSWPQARDLPFSIPAKQRDNGANNNAVIGQSLCESALPSRSTNTRLAGLLAGTGRINNDYYELSIITVANCRPNLLIYVRPLRKSGASSTFYSGSGSGGRCVDLSKTATQQLH